MSQGKYEAAANVLVQIAKVNGKAENEQEEIRMKMQKFKAELEKENDDAEKSSPLDFFRYPTMRKRFLLICANWLGVYAIYFGFQINVKNLIGNEFLNFFLISAIEFPAHLLAWWLMERIGRRWCTVGSFLVACLAGLIPGVAPPDHGSIGIIASLLGKSGASAAFMSMYLHTPEIYPTTLRGVGLGMSNAVGHLMSIVCPYIVCLAKYSESAPFLALSAISLMAATCASLLPETLNKKLPQTIEEAENFEDDHKFFSCFQQAQTVSSISISG
ncbi:carcinine transporter-like [Uloborus diversus]|uniref:carcinine transporter-like n=1 Tax=Uloborus diversus TaxID=327109 RepID=UPI002409BBB0|nr:carcinine transporter-like [Uloborus diversus]